MCGVSVQECIDAIKVGLQEFGEYTYNDKGAHAVIDMSPLVDGIKEMGPEDAADMLLTLAEQYDKAERFICDVTLDLQCQPEDWWNKFMAYRNGAMTEFY